MHTNYAQCFSSLDHNRFVYPSTKEDLRDIVVSARANNHSIRVLGNSHSLTTLNIPRKNEIVVLLDKFNSVILNQDHSITADAGVEIKVIARFLNILGLDLPIINGGLGSPTVAGFIYAGGIGKTEASLSLGRSAVYGGFWNHVNTIEWIDGFGNFHISTKSDSLFNWFFGSMGQFSIIVKATLSSINPSGSKLPDDIYKLYSKPFSLSKDDQSYSQLTENTKRTLWVSTFCHPENELKAWNIFEDWVLTSNSIIRPVSNARWAGPDYYGLPIGYLYTIKSLGMNAPLVYDTDRDFLVLGIAFETITGNNHFNQSLIMQINKCYKILLEHKFSLYASVENISNSYSPEQVYSKNNLEFFRYLRDKYGFSGFINDGWLDNLILPEIDFKHV